MISTYSSNLHLVQNSLPPIPVPEVTKNSNLEIVFLLGSLDETCSDSIRIGQEALYQAFLQMKKISEIEQNPQDPEEYFAKQLLRAHREACIEEQIVYLVKLGDIHLQKKDWFKTAKILNCSIAIFQKNLPESTIEEYLFYRLEKLEILFLENLENESGYKVSLENCQTSKETRGWLKGIREASLKDFKNSVCKEEDLVEDLHLIESVAHRLTGYYKKILCLLIENCVKQLGNPPLQDSWACIGMGSLAQNEVCLYSEIKFAFLITQRSDKMLRYFRTLAQFLELKIINLGETVFPVFPCDKSPISAGFSVHSGGFTPLGIPKMFELIDTPEGLVQYQSDHWIDQNIALLLALSSVCHIAGSQELTTQYQQAKDKRLNAKSTSHTSSTSKKKFSLDFLKSSTLTSRTFKRKFALDFLKGEIKAFKPDLSEMKEKKHAIDIKRELLRPMQIIFELLALFCDIPTGQSLLIIEALFKKNRISLEGKKNLLQAFRKLIHLQFEAQDFYKGNEHFLYYLELGNEQDLQSFYINEKRIDMLQEIYRTWLPFYSSIQRFLQTDKVEILKDQHFYDDTLIVQGKKYEMNGECDKAREAFQQAVALNPHDIQSQFAFGDLEEKMGNLEKALQRYLKALELTKYKYKGIKHPEVAKCYQAISSIYLKMKNIEKTLEYEKYTLDILLDTYGENHPEVATSFMTIGNLCSRSANYKESVHNYQNALNIHSKSSRENDLVVVMKKLLTTLKQIPFSERNNAYALCLQITEQHRIFTEILDFAIQNGQDDFLRCFLDIPPKQYKDALTVKDMEGFYYKQLIEAKKEELVEEQILCLQMISEQYINKGQLLVGAKILNCALALLYKLPKYPSENRFTIFGEYILERLEQVEIMFLKNKDIQLKHTQSLAHYRNRLKEIRNTCTEQAKTFPVQEVLANLTGQFKALLKTLIIDSQMILGKPPVSWACVGMGSMSRDEMCPYSDIEFAFIVADETEESMAYFRTLSQILELRIINLGETKFPVFGERYPSPTPDGFCMDTGGNTPLGVTGVYELIGKPSSLAQFQSIQWMDRSIILPNAMSHVCFVAGEESLVSDYYCEMKKVQEEIEHKKKSKEKNHKVLSIKLLAGHIEEFSPNLSKEKEQIGAFGIKKELYRPFQEIIASLALFYQLKAKTTFSRIDELASVGIFSTEGAENVKKAINCVLFFRMNAHLFYKNEEEFLCHSEQDKPLDPSLLYFSKQSLQLLEGIYRILIPFHRSAEQFLTSKDHQAFKCSNFYDDRLSEQGKTLCKKLQYSKAHDVRQQAVALNPNDIDALIYLGSIENDIGLNKDALPRNLKALELAIRKHGENHSIVATIHNNIGITYIKLGNYDKALEYLQMGLKMNLQLFGDKHQNVAMNYNNIALVYDELGEDNKALEFKQKSLEIRIETLGENHQDTALIYNNLGVTYDTLGNYNKALECYQNSLKIYLELFGQYHPMSATCINNIGRTYSMLGDFEKGMEHYQKALKTLEILLGENHPTVGLSYNNIATSYYNKGNYKNALAYYEKSLQIRLKVLGEKHHEVGASYCNIGVAYYCLGNYEQALEYNFKGVEIRKQHLGENHPDVATSYGYIGTAYNSLKEYEKSLNYHQMALEIQLKVYHENHRTIATSYNNIAVSYKYLKNYEKSLEFFEKALNIYLQILDENHPNIALSYNNIGVIYDDLKQYEKALENLQKALDIRLKSLNENHPHVAINYYSFGLVFDHMGQYEKSLDYHLKCLQIHLQTLGENHPSFALSYNDIAKVYGQMGNDSEAIKNCIKSLEITCKRQDKTDLAERLELFVNIAKKIPDFKLENFEHIQTLCIEKLGEDHELIKTLLFFQRGSFDAI